jgi:hypothetical protein
LRDFFIERQKTDWQDFSVCDNGGFQPVTREELERRKGSD